MSSENSLGLLILLLGFPTFLSVAGILNLYFRRGTATFLYLGTVVLALPLVLSMLANLFAGPNGSMGSAIAGILSMPLALGSVCCFFIATFIGSARIPKSEFIALVVAVVAVMLMI
ncbi:MAG: hypothetical protein AAGA08_10640 [Pseudomonadota bacterium]